MLGYCGSVLSQKSIKVCYFGSYDPNYARNKIIRKGLIKNGIKVIEHNVAMKSIFIRYLKLIEKEIHNEKYDIIIVGERGNSLVPLAKILSKLKRVPLIFDPFISLYDTSVFDRKVVKEDSIRATILYLLDKIPLHLSDLVLTDTKQHAEYFHREFDVDRSKMRTIYIGADLDIFQPLELTTTNEEAFKVVFHGSFIPLQGITYVSETAKILERENIQFDLIGSGQTYYECSQQAKKLNVKNVKFHGWKSYEEIVSYIGKADICLGIFGDTNKAKRVIPNKVYEVIAMKKALITADTPAIKEVFTNKKNVLLCKSANAQSLADAILELKDDEDLRKKIAEKGYNLFTERFTTDVIGRDVKNVIEEALSLS